MSGIAQDGAAGLRERKKRERKRALQRTAIQLSLEHGYANVTVDDICEACDVSQRTFFNYFASKEQAVIGGDETIVDDADATAVATFEAGGPTGDLLDDFRALLTAVVDSRAESRDNLEQRARLVRSDPDLLQAQMARLGRNEEIFRQVIRRRLAQEASGHDHGTATPDQCADLDRRVQTVACLGLSVLRMTFERLRSPGRSGRARAPNPVPEIFDELTTLCTRETP